MNPLEKNTMNGVILLNKPAGITSFDAVGRCRKAYQEKRVGHTGTLDPNASGLLIILLGKYTKMLPYCVKDHKHYHAGFSFGSRSDTGDVWGTVVEERKPQPHTPEQLQNAMNAMLGESDQIPPMYSAVKVEGKKLYQYARKGVEIDRKPRRIQVYSGTISRDPEGKLFMDAEVSGGTYIRTLIEDYAARLNELAVMTSLERTGIESLKLDQACTMEDLGGTGCLHAIEEVLDPSIPVLDSDREWEIRNGKPLALDSASSVVLVRCGGIILAAYELQKDGTFHCQRGLW
jgi:tRNA pseudouridine55 synthase